MEESARVLTMGDIYQDILNDKDLSDQQKLQFLSELPPPPKAGQIEQSGGTSVGQLKAANPQAGSGINTVREGGGFVPGESTGTSVAKDVARYAVPAAVIGASMPFTAGMSPLAIYGTEAVLGGATEAAMQAAGINRQDPSGIAAASVLPGAGRAVMSGGALAINKGMHLIPGFNQAARGALTPEARTLGEKLFDTPVGSEALYAALKQQSGGTARLTQFPTLQKATKEMRTDIENISWEQLQADLRQAGLENLFDDIEKSIAGSPAKLAKMPPRTVSGTLGDAIPQHYASTIYGTVPLDSLKQAEQVAREFPSLHVFEKAGARPIVGDRKTTPILGAGLPSQMQVVQPGTLPGMTFVQAKANIEGMGKMIANATDDKKRGAYKRLYGSMLTDLENMEAPAGTPVALWKEAREAYRTEKTRTLFQDLVEKNTANVEGVPLVNPDGILKALRTNKTFTDRLSKAQLDTLTNSFTEMAKLTGKNPQRLMGVLAGMAVSHSAGGALTGYVASDLLSKAMMSESGRKAVMTIIKKEGPSEYFRRAGSIIGAALTGLNEPASEDIANPFSGQQIGTLPMENRTEPKAVEPSAPVPAIQLTPEDIKAKVTKAAKDTKLDPKLFHAVVSTESNYNPNAVSPVGAVGLTQLMPKTAAGLGVNPLLVDENLKGGATYLQSLLKKYDGDKAKALAAYNAGPGRVDKGGPLPQETQGYVAKIMMKLGGTKDDKARR